MTADLLVYVFILFSVFTVSALKNMEARRRSGARVAIFARELFWKLYKRSQWFMQILVYIYDSSCLSL